MGGTKGYRSYRGRTSKGKIALAVVLVQIIQEAGMRLSRLGDKRIR